MSDKSDAIAVMETVRAETLDAISGIPEEKTTVAAFGTWSVKDVLCHLASWEQFAVPDLQRISRGHIPQLATLRLEEVDEWNAGLMRSRNLFSLPQ
ncbi:MAG: DinB family protein, partial [Dehalococcoidia bacterium]